MSCSFLCIVFVFLYCCAILSVSAEDKDPCDSSPCLNGGFCIGDEGSYSCICESPFSGFHCETDPCNSNPCKNGSKCRITGESHTCDCVGPFYGSDCEDSLDQCVLKPCKNQGICITDGGDFKCNCTPSYTGRTCEEVLGLDLCYNEPCGAHGVCRMEADDIKCNCTSPYTGKTCEQGPCDPNPCQNEGKCKVVGEEYTCLCKTPFSGYHCEKDACASNADCRNGGVCLEDTDGGNYCQCKNGTSGDFCEVVDECVENPTKCGTGSDVQCVYDLVTEKVNCTCNNASKGFDSYVKKCRVPCTSDEDCVYVRCRKNRDNDLRFCKCPWGAGGDTCTEEVDECKEKGIDCGNNPNVTCTEGSRGESLCYCEVGGWSVAFDYDAKDCRNCECGGYDLGCKFLLGSIKKCYCNRQYYQTDGKCEACECGYGSNGCYLENGTKVCECWKPYLDNGGFCEECICGGGSTGCTFENGEKICACKPGYIQANGTCKRNCTALGVECQHGSKCVDDVCHCLPTTSGEVCEVMDWCKNNWDKNLKCGYRDDVTCFFNETSLESFCQCNDSNYFYDPLVQNCRVCDCGESGHICTVENGKKFCTCKPNYIEVNGTCRTNCTSLDGQCKRGSKCVDDACQCLPGTRGDLCDVIDGCATLWDRIAKCDYKGSALCEFNETSLETYCQCKNKDYLYDSFERKCKACDCGLYGTCSFVKGQRTCACKEGYVEQPSRWSDEASECVPCNCGRPSSGCTFIDYDHKQCHCDNGYSQRFGKCSECDCGPGGDCLFDGLGKKVCDCNSGLEEKNGLCVECDCGYYGKCEFNDEGEKICNCVEGYEDKDGKCTYCTCYLDDKTISCYFIDGMQKCVCPEGYEGDDYPCTDINECLNRSACPEKTTCRNTEGNYTCTCDYGYRPWSNQHDTKRYGCTDINECLENNACPYRDTTECFNTQGSYYCQCKDGYYYRFSQYAMEFEGCEKDQRAWRTGYIVLIVLLIVAIIGLMTAIIRKRLSS